MSLKNALESQTSEEREANRKRWEEHERRQELERFSILWKQAGVPERHAAKVSDGSTDEGPTQWQAAKEKLLSLIGTGCLVGLIGPRGTGKTQLSAAGIYEACRLDMRSRYFKALDLFVLLRDTYRSGATERGALDTFVEPKLLVIDELQNRGNSEWEDTMLTNLIDRRYDRGDRDTIIIANLKRSEFEKAVGASIADRMRETGGCLECTWRSLRTPP